MTNGVQRLSDALGDRSVDVSQDIRTDVEIISDPGSPSSIYSESEGNLTVLVKNTGSETLTAAPSEVDVTVDGQYVTPSTVTVVGGDSWRPGAVARVNASVSLGGGDHRVVVVVNGDREVLEFRTA